MDLMRYHRDILEQNWKELDGTVPPFVLAIVMLTCRLVDNIQARWSVFVSSLLQSANVFQGVAENIHFSLEVIIGPFRVPLV